MFKVLVEKEVREIIGSTKFAVSFGVCAVLIILAFYMGAMNYKSSRSHYEAAVAENRRQLDGITDWFAVQQFRIFLPPEPVASLVNGVSNDVARITEIRGRGELNSYESRFGEEPILAIFRFLDLDFLFQVILSLFAILLCYDAVSGEKERGTLRLVFANGVPRAQFLLGKITGSIVAIGVPLLASIAIGALLLPMLGVPMSSVDWTRLALIVGTGLLYVVCFMAISVLVSSLTSRSSNSFLILLVIWIAAVQLVPRASVLVAGRMVDVPTTDELAAKKNKLASQLWQEDRDKMANFKPTNTTDMEATMQEFNAFMEKNANERDAKNQELANRLNEDRANKQAIQAKLGFNLARLSPAASFTFAAARLAGTDLGLKNHYSEQASLYQQTYAAFIKSKTGFNPGGRMVRIIADNGKGEKPKPIDPNELPAFQYASVPLGEEVAAASGDVGLLAIYALLAFAGAFIAFNRYDLR
jgi:ABC-type transport system involved in multi-copper enzyme maturation permease subunit